jgi:hypothetical protein
MKITSLSEKVARFRAHQPCLTHVSMRKDSEAPTLSAARQQRKEPLRHQPEQVQLAVAQSM